MRKGTKSTSSVSQAIRDYASANPGLGPTQISKDLQAQGINAYPALVSQAIRGMSEGKARGKRGRPKGSKAATKKTKGASPSVDYMATLKATAEFVKLCGSAESAIESIKTLQKITSLLS